jgi:hypothetical protein
VKGKGKVGEPEIILQALFPEQLVLNQIFDTSNLLLLRAKYLSFFVEVSLKLCIVMISFCDCRCFLIA